MVKRLRGLVSIPTLGLAAAGMGAAAAVAIVLLSGGSGAPSPSNGAVAPFYMEAVVTQYVEPDDSTTGTVEGVGTGRSIRSRQIVRWSHQDGSHARFEFERTDPPLSAGIITVVLDGTTLATYSSADNAYEISQLTPSSIANGFFWPGRTILFGPAIEPTIPRLLERLSHWNEGPLQPGGLPAPTTPIGISYGSAVRVGETQMLGRRVAVLERSPAPNEQTVKFWVDPETMQVLRHESNVGRWVAEVTVFDAAPRFEASLFQFQPPPGAVDRHTTTPLAAPPLHGRDTPSGFYEPSGEALGLQLGEVRSEADTNGVVFYRSEFEAISREGIVLLTFEQRRNAANLPLTLAAGERLAVGGHEAYLSQAGQELRLAWSDGRLWLLLSTTWLSRDQLLAFAGSLQLAP